MKKIIIAAVLLLAVVNPWLALPLKPRNITFTSKRVDVNAAFEMMESDKNELYELLKHSLFYRK